MAETGPHWEKDVAGNVHRMVSEFSAVLANAPKVRQVHRDLAYGPHARHRLDIYMPDESVGPRPVLLFVHGGAFVNGNLNVSAEIYSNVLHYFALHGIVGVNIEYRLAPEATYPAATLDVAAAVAWVRAHGANYGINPNAMFLMGHSAGATHAASYAYDRRWQPPGGHGLDGLIVVSGRVRADVAPDNPNASKVKTYYPNHDAKSLDDCSPVTHTNADSVRTFIAYAEFENPLLDVYSLELAYRIALARRRAQPILYLPGHNHTSIIAHINTSEDVLGSAVRAFIAAP